MIYQIKHDRLRAVTRNARHRGDEPDALDEMIAEFTEVNPDFPQLLLSAQRRRALLRALAEERRRRELSQTRVAAAMRTSQPTLARLETTAADTKLSTVERFAGALGYAIEYHLVPMSKSKRRQGIVIES
jgi:RNase adaptor protein for sRNA GlmZ degradation